MPKQLSVPATNGSERAAKAVITKEREAALIRHRKKCGGPTLRNAKTAGHKSQTSNTVWGDQSSKCPLVEKT